MLWEKEVLQALTQAAQTPVLCNHPLSQECTFKIGGPAKYFCQPRSPQALRNCLLVLKTFPLPYRIVGGGSNLLFADEGFPGVILSTRGMKLVQWEKNGRLRAEAGLSNHELTAITENYALSGFEWAAGLPGTLGGGVYMNAKCYGKMFSRIVSEVVALTPQAEWVTLPAPECGFAYKKSVFQNNGFMITEIVLQLSPGNLDTIRQQGLANLLDREKKGQFRFPSAGCVFKNATAINMPAGRLIENCGFKGRQIGDAQVYEAHANFIINRGKARAQEVKALMAEIKKAVWEKYQHALEEEIQIVE